MYILRIKLTKCIPEIYKQKVYSELVKEMRTRNLVPARGGFDELPFDMAVGSSCDGTSEGLSLLPTQGAHLRDGDIIWIRHRSPTRHSNGGTGLDHWQQSYASLLCCGKGHRRRSRTPRFTQSDGLRRE